MSNISQSTCAICGPDLTAHQRYLGGICDDWRCRKAVLDGDIAAHRVVAAEALSIDDVDAHFSFVVPNNEGRIGELSTRRRRNFRAHLRRILRAAAEPDDDEMAESAEGPAEVDEQNRAETLSGRETDLLRGACAACRGTCCKDGGDHAFLDRDRMRRIIEEEDFAGANALIDTYSSYLPASNFQNGCVFQAEAGCTLPRDLRADICNGYECAGLKSFRRRLEEHGPTKGFAVVRENNRIKRSIFFDERESHPYPATSESSADR